MPDRFVRGAVNSKKLRELLVMSGVLPDDKLDVRTGIVHVKLDEDKTPLSVHLLTHKMNIVRINMNSVGYQIGEFLHGKSVEVVGALCSEAQGESLTPISFRAKQGKAPMEKVQHSKAKAACSTSRK